MNRNRGKILLGPVTLVMVAISLAQVLPAQAQDAHYWSNQHGTRSVLLGGAVIGSVSDLSANFYNPGALGLAEEPELVLAAKVYQYTGITLSRSGEVTAELSSGRFDEAPGYFAGLLPFKFLGKNRLSYTLFTRLRSDIEAQDFQQIPGSEIEGLDPDDLLLEQLGFREQVSDNWYGLSWGTKFGEKIGFGASSFLAYRSQDLRLHSITQVLSDGDTTAIVVYDNEFGYDVASLILKLGVQYRHKKLSAGATVTTPGLRIGGRGEIKTYRTLVDQGVGGGQETYLAAGEAKDLNAEYRYPWSVGGGIGYDFGKRSVHFSAEWFSPVDQYNVFNTGVFTPQAGVDTVVVDITAELNSVLNFGFGYSEELGQHFVVYGSFTTDYSAVDPETRNNIALADWNIYNLFTGAEFTFKGADFHVGLGYSFGSQDATDVLEFDETLTLIDQPSPERRAEYSALKGMIGVAFTIR